MMSNGIGGVGGPLPPASQTDQSPRQKAFLDDLRQRRAKIVQATYDRTAQNPKELTVTRGEYFEVSAIKCWGLHATIATTDCV